MSCQSAPAPNLCLPHIGTISTVAFAVSKADKINEEEARGQQI
ncbi:unnamed protein product, partial [Staurois parvus]